MACALQTLLTGILDYAGLFPPAKLPLDQAIDAYARYRQDPDSWMLGRFVCPIEQVAELPSLVAKLFSPAAPLTLSVVGYGGGSAAEFLGKMRNTVSAVAAFQERTGGSAQVTAYEVRLPAELLTSPEDGCRLMENAASIVRNTLYYEIPLSATWSSAVTLLSKARAGFKMRCGGASAADFSSPQQVALGIALCRAAGVPLKFTAGLHRPLR